MSYKNFFEHFLQNSLKKFLHQNSSRQNDDFFKLYNINEKELFTSFNHNRALHFIYDAR